MKKPLIKIVKRSREIVVETNNESEVFDNSLKAERLAKREMTETIAGWIIEQREQSRLAENIARRKVFAIQLRNKRR